MKGKRYLLLLFALRPLILLILAPCPLQAATFQIKPVVLQGDPAPGGGTFTQLITRFSTGVSTPLNDAGAVAFGAAVRRDGQEFAGIFSWANGTIAPVVKHGDPAPGGVFFMTPGLFSSFSPSLNRTGAIAFQAFLEVAGFPFGGGLFLTAGGESRAIVKFLDPYPCDITQGHVFGNLGPPALSDQGGVAFFANGAEPPNFPGIRGLICPQQLFLASGGNLTPIVRGAGTGVIPRVRFFFVPGDPAPGGGFFSRFARRNAFPRVSMNSKGAIAFNGVYTNTPETCPFFFDAFQRCENFGLFLSSGGTLTAIARDGDPAPGGGTFGGTGEGTFGGALNNVGAVAFIALTELGHSSGLYLAAPDGVLTLIARQGDPAPGGGTFNFFNSVALNDAGTIAFVATVCQQGFIDCRGGLFLASRGGVTPILRNGDSVPGLGTFRSLRNPVFINNRGQLVFQADLQRGGQTGEGIFLVSTAIPVEVVDPVPDLQVGPAITTDVVTLAEKGRVVQKVAADGVTQAVLRVTPPEAGTVELTLVDEAGIPLGSAEEAGTLRTLEQPSGSSSVFVPTVEVQGIGTRAFAIYQAPSRFARTVADHGEKDRKVGLRVRFTPQTGGDPQESTTEITIARPPLVLVHGLWGSRDSWKGFGPLFTALITDSRFFVESIDYSGTHAAGLAVNAPKIDEKISSVVDKYKTANQVAAIQADVVAHSMGGLLVRMLPLLGSSYFRDDNFQKGDVHKLINIGTPHFGSPLARFLRRSPCVSQEFNKRGRPTDQGAIDDLVPNSRVLNNLNRTASTLPLHQIVGLASGGDKFASETSPGFLYLRRQCPREFRGIPFGRLFDTLLQTPDHDLIVPASSQQGGASGNVTTFPPGPNVIHIRVPLLLIGLGELDSEEISQRVIQLLNSPASPPFFAPFGGAAGGP